MGKNSPTVSVIVPTYNRAHLIGRAIQSVLNQTYQDFEIIIIDDGSTDNTEQKVNEFKDSRIVYLHHETNRGAQVARNTGIRTTRGRYIALLDSDDKWLPEKMALQLAVFEKGSPNLGVVYSDVMIANAEGKVVNPHYRFPHHRGDIYKFVLEKCSLVPCSVLLVKRECFQRIGLFDERLYAWQDDDICIRLAKHYEFDFVPQPLAVLHAHCGPRISNDLFRVAQGYLVLIEIHKNEIIRYRGNKTLSRHYIGIGKRFMAAREFKSAQRVFFKSVCTHLLLGCSVLYWGVSLFPPVFLVSRVIMHAICAISQNIQQCLLSSILKRFNRGGNSV